MKGDSKATADIIPVDLATNMLIAIGWYTATNRQVLNQGSQLSYFFGYDTAFFSFQNNPKNLYLSFNFIALRKAKIVCNFGHSECSSVKMDLDLWDCLGRVKLVLLQNFIGLV